MADVVVYVSRVCGYCSLAKRLLQAKGVAFREVDVSDDPAQRRWLAETTGQRTVPQIFIDGEPQGGFRELAALDRSGELDVLLGR